MPSSTPSTAVVAARILFLRAAVALIVISPASCVDSIHPLADPETCTIDERLVGVWKHVGERDVSYFFIGRPAHVKDRPDGMLLLHDPTLNAKHELSWTEAWTYCFAVRIGESHYLQCIKSAGRNKIDKWERTTVKAYQFFMYEVAGERLTFWLMDKGAVKKAIEAGVLKGTVKENHNITSPEVTLTDSTDHLRRHLATDQGKLLFSKELKLTLERVK
jgi:hypothetical protein